MTQKQSLQQVLEQDIGQLHVALRRTELERDAAVAERNAAMEELAVLRSHMPGPLDHPA